MYVHTIIHIFMNISQKLEVDMANSFEDMSLVGGFFNFM